VTLIVQYKIVGDLDMLRPMATQRHAVHC